jgi:HSP20 family protein
MRLQTQFKEETVAEVKVSKSSSEEQRGKQTQSGGLSRRLESHPSMFMLHPREFFSMSPFTLMRRFTEEMDRVFAGAGGESHEMGLWSPAIEVREREGNLQVYAELPGLNKEDVKVEVTSDGLVIQGTRKQEHEEKQEGFYRSERSYGKFYRVVPLPEDAKIEEARAQFNNGILEVTVPIPQSQQQQRRREIPVETGQAQDKTRTSGGGAA